jgi:alpha,alpha-trehalase
MPDTERQLAERVRTASAARGLALLLDFDGTLCEFEPDPAAVRLSPARRGILQELQPRAILALISGRRLADVRERSGLDGVPVAGLHGLEIEGFGERFVHPDLDKAAAAVAAASARLHRVAAGIPGSFVEDKGASVALHFRQADAAGRRAATAGFAETAAPYVDGGRLRVMRGSNVFELLPDIEWNKGDAVRWMVERIRRGRDPLVVYIGDDVTDQYALDAVQALGGMAITASRRARAPEQLDGPPAVERFLAAL